MPDSVTLIPSHYYLPFYSLNFYGAPITRKRRNVGTSTPVSHNSHHFRIHHSYFSYVFLSLVVDNFSLS